MNNQSSSCSSASSNKMLKLATIRVTPRQGYYSVGGGTERAFHTWNEAEDFMEKVALRNRQDDYLWGDRKSKDEGVEVRCLISFEDGRSFSGEFKVGLTDVAVRIDLAAWLGGSFETKHRDRKFLDKYDVSRN